ncbi:MAG: hypothetical protein ACI81R_002338 [Bradymonadia bacterium]|jgi:hypothetical protein
MTKAHSHQQANKIAALMQEANDAGETISRRIYYDRIHLGGYVDKEGLLKSAPIKLFRTREGTIGNGFTRNLTPADTSVEEADGKLASGTRFVADSVGIYIDEAMPEWLSNAVLNYGTITRQIGANRYQKLGKTLLWPTGEFGVSGGNGNAQGASDSQNGSGRMKMLPAAAPLIFLPDNTIDMELEVHTPVYVTADGKALTASNVIDRSGTPLESVMKGSYSANQREICGCVHMFMEGWEFSKGA